ncbi:hypothetical protein MTO96_032894 [Rhipicephalus appendiculatus]
MPGRRPYLQVIDGGDIVLSTYPKSGTHWILYITQLILNRGKPISSFDEFTRNHRAIEYVGTEGWVSPMPFRLFRTHLPLSRDAMNEEAKYIYIARNPWDVCASQFRMTADLSSSKFEDGTFEEFFEPFSEGDLGYGSYFDHVASAYALKDEHNVFFVTYEDLKKDTKSEVLRLASFLGESYGEVLRSDSQMLENIVELSKPGHMRKVILVNLSANESQEWNELFVKKQITSKEGYRGDHSKYALVKDAKVGGWKEYFTPDLLGRFEKRIQEEGDKASFMELWVGIRRQAVKLSREST